MQTNVNWGGKTETPKVRNERIDSVKYWLIILVIIGHILDFGQFRNTFGFTTICRWIYMFHMPLFVFLSGYFSYKKKSKDLFSSIWKLLEPLILFQIIALVLIYITKGEFSWNDLFTPWWALWYLLSLIYWRLMLQIIPDRILNNTKLILIVTFIISILAGFLPFDRFLSMQRTLSFLPFFFFGYCLKGKNLFLPNKYRPWCFLFLLLTFAITLFFSQYLGGLAHADPYGNIYDMYKRILVFGISIPISIAFVNICPNTPFAVHQGRFTMQYYIFHGFMIQVIMAIVVKYNLPMSLFTVALFTIIIVITISIASNIPQFRKLTNPSQFFKK